MRWVKRVVWMVRFCRMIAGRMMCRVSQIFYVTDISSSPILAIFFGDPFRFA
jgi:hypothetical protein